MYVHIQGNLTLQILAFVLLLRHVFQRQLRRLHVHVPNEEQSSDIHL
jgi:hypothetical protein